MNSNINSPFPDTIGSKMPTSTYNYNDHIIKPPELNIKKGKESIRFVVDSRDRDYNLYPNPNNYVIPLTNEIRGVTSIELVKGCIPNSQYNINHTNNTLHYKLEDNCELICQEIPVGNYTVSELESELNTIFSGILAFVYISKTKKFNIKATNKIELIFKNCACKKCNDNSDKKCKFCCSYQKKEYIKSYDSSMQIYHQTTIGPVLGFPPDNLIIEGGESKLAPNIVNIDTCKYVILAITELNKLKSNTDCIHDAYTIIPFDCGASCALINASTSPNMSDVKNYNPPKSKFTKLTIKFLNYDGSLYDFNGVDHVLDFRVYSLNYKDIYV